MEEGDVEVEGKGGGEGEKFKYLGYVLMRNGGQEAHIEERVRKGAAVMGQVWGIGKRRFGKDWGRRVWLYDKLVWATVSYGLEIWGWKGKGQSGETGGTVPEMGAGSGEIHSMVYGKGGAAKGDGEREGGDEGMGVRKEAGGRGWGELARRCWEEIKGRARRGKALGGWEEERKEYYEGRGWTIEGIEEMRGRGG